MKRYPGLFRQFTYTCVLLLFVVSATRGSTADKPDLLIYGATPSGIAAAIAAAKSGMKVILAEPTPHFGGLLTSGLSHTDYHSYESLTGTFGEFVRRVEAHYVKTYGPASAQAKDCFRGTFGEPKVNREILRQMLAEHPTISLCLRWRLTAVRREAARISEVTFAVEEKAQAVVSAKVYIDATYEGDLMAKAGVEWRAGREAMAEYGESLAPEKADGQLQAYNFRFTMTKIPENRVSVRAPLGYRREDFVGILPILASGRIKRLFGYPLECVFKAQTPPLPNGKYDINDVSKEIVRLSLPGKNLEWPDGDEAQRSRIHAEHLRDQVGLLYFLQNDEEVPAKFRAEAREWGWCKDEFVETDHLPPLLYVREARRMVGRHIYAQRDSMNAPGDARAVLQTESIAMGDYGNNCHGTAHEGPRFGGKHVGEFYHSVPPYQVPYGVLLPRKVDNLLVCGAISSSHVGYCALRLEPIWTALGQASGYAAGIAIVGQIPVGDVNVSVLQRRLHDAKAATIYVSDVGMDSPDFAAVQWWGTAGGLHGLEAPIKGANKRGKKIHGQYSQAFPGQEARMQETLREDVERKWRHLSGQLGLPVNQLPTANGKTTRGDFIRAAYALRR